MIVEGLKNLNDGISTIVRYSYVKGQKSETARYKLVKKDEKIVLFNGDEDITKEIRRLEIKKNEVLMWINPSRLGLRYYFLN